MIDDYVAKGFWDRVCIADILEQNARNWPDKEAIVDSESRLTWSQLNRLVDRTALGLLELGIKRDQAIVAQIPNSTIAVILLLACQKAGILSCFSPMTFRHNEMPQGASSFQSLLCTSVGGQELEEVLKEHAFGPFEVSAIVQSSGTTGMPKCIEHTGASCKVAGWGIIGRNGSSGGGICEDRWDVS